MVYERSWNDDEIRDYIINHIKKSVENDAGVAIKAYWDDYMTTKEGKGYFAVPRMLFPEIDGLGSYITGKPKATGLNIKTYLTQIMGKLDKKYSIYASFIVFIFRNGLLHQHAPKQYKYMHREIGWGFVIGSPNNPIEVQRKFHLIFNGNTLMIDMNVFYYDLVLSIELAVEIIISEYKESFERSVKEQFKPLYKTSLLKNVRKYDKSRRYIYPVDFEFLKKI